MLLVWACAMEQAHFEVLANSPFANARISLCRSSWGSSSKFDNRTSASPRERIFDLKAKHARNDVLLWSNPPIADVDNGPGIHGRTNGVDPETGVKMAQESCASLGTRRPTQPGLSSAFGSQVRCSGAREMSITGPQARFASRTISGGSPSQTGLWWRGRNSLS